MNLRPPECKSGALPTELQPHNLWLAVDQVGLRGLEPRTSALSAQRSNHLSYKPKSGYATVLPINRFDLSQIALRYSLKGGDPAAPSGTATLLRLRPSYQSYLNELPPEG